MTPPAPARSRPLAWAVFLASSWTWVIGMYLPVLLVRDFGVAGWVAFAVPNVVGAAAMGWVLRSSADSEAFVARHRPAVAAFSAVTVAFHVFVVGWLLPRLIGPAAIGATAAVVAAAVFGGRKAEGGRRRAEGGGKTESSPSSALRPPTSALADALGNGATIAAAGAFAASLAAFAYLLLAGGPTAAFGRPPSRPGDLAGLALACAFGFGLCPYLDVTFHRARQATGERSRLAFGVGFGVLFLLMIAFTLAYSGAILAAAPGGALAWVLAGHVAVQSTFTVWAHARGLNALAPTPGAEGNPPRRPRSPLLISVACAAGVIAATVALRLERPGGGFTSGGGIALAGLGAGEVGYRSFMAFYGLIFPAYVLIAAVGMTADRPPARRLAIAGVAVALAAPFYAIAFVGRREVWVGFGLAIVMAGWLSVRFGERRRGDREGAKARRRTRRRERMG